MAWHARGQREVVVSSGEVTCRAKLAGEVELGNGRLAGENDARPIGTVC
jgi:hypothetical protein